MMNLRKRRHLEQLILNLKDVSSVPDQDKYDYLKSDSGTLIIDNKFFVFFDWYEDYCIFDD